MTNDLYWIWLASRKLNDKTLTVLLEVYGSANGIYNEREFNEVRGLDNKTMSSLKDKNLHEAEKILLGTEAAGGYVLSWEDEEYPPKLRQIYNPPIVLYVKGLIPNWNQMLVITVVGTRTFGAYGKNATEFIVRGLTRKGASIASGMARGIDTVACRTAVEEGSFTIAVIGNGLDLVYPAENKGLFNRICQNGIIMTEYPPGSKPLKHHFPRRNRIMAGLANGVLVAQAPENSGALITATYAIENGRDVFAVPGDIFDMGHAGTNGLLQKGAKAVMNADDILVEYPYIKLKPKENNKQNSLAREKSEEFNTSVNAPAKDASEGLTGLEADLVRLLSSGGRDLDSIIREIGGDASAVNAAVIMLEIQGRIKRSGGGWLSLT